MAKEHAFWLQIRSALRKECALERIENLVSRGMADVNGALRANGREWWMELKSIAKWPTKPDTFALTSALYTLDQAYWLKERWDISRNTFLALRVLGFAGSKPEILVIPGSHALHVYQATQERWRKCALWPASRLFPTTAFLEYVTNVAVR